MMLASTDEWFNIPGMAQLWQLNCDVCPFEATTACTDLIDICPHGSQLPWCVLVNNRITKGQQLDILARGQCCMAERKSVQLCLFLDVWMLTALHGTDLDRSLLHDICLFFWWAWIFGYKQAESPARAAVGSYYNQNSAAVKMKLWCHGGSEIHVATFLVHVEIKYMTLSQDFLTQNLMLWNAEYSTLPSVYCSFAPQFWVMDKLLCWSSRNLKACRIQ